MPIVDDFGVWEGLGTVATTFDWQFFPLFPSTPNSTLRINYLGEFGGAVYSPPAYLRAAYFSGSQYFFDKRWVKLFPKDEPEIVQYPYPPDLINDPLPSRQFQIKLAPRYRFSALSVLSFYTVQLFEKQSTNVVYPTESATTQRPSRP